MKALLGSLLCLVLFASECFALKGGPPYPVGTSISGVYAGVLQPAFDPNNQTSSNSLGIFTLGIPDSGASTGDFIVFTRGRVFGGSIQGVADPNRTKLSALLNATFTYTLTTFDSTGNPVTTDVTATVNGTLTARITSPNNSLSPTSAFLTGDAQAFVDNGEVDLNGDVIVVDTLLFDVMGFRQSTVAPAAGTLTPPSP